MEFHKVILGSLISLMVATGSVAIAKTHHKKHGPKHSVYSKRQIENRTASHTTPQDASTSDTTSSTESHMSQSARSVRSNLKTKRHHHGHHKTRPASDPVLDK